MTTTTIDICPNCNGQVKLITSLKRPTSLGANYAKTLPGVGLEGENYVTQPIQWVFALGDLLATRGGGAAVCGAIGGCAGLMISNLFGISIEAVLLFGCICSAGGFILPPSVQYAKNELQPEPELQPEHESNGRTFQIEILHKNESGTTRGMQFLHDLPCEPSELQHIARCAVEGRLAEKYVAGGGKPVGEKTYIKVRDILAARGFVRKEGNGKTAPWVATAKGKAVFKAIATAPLDD